MNTSIFPRFARFLSSLDVVAFTLGLQIFHLVISYTKLLVFSNLDRTSLWFDVPVSFLMAFGLSFATITIVKQHPNNKVKALFAFGDFAGIVGYYNRGNFDAHNPEQLIISVFFGFFCAISLYNLGYLSKLHLTGQLALLYSHNSLTVSKIDEDLAQIPPEELAEEEKAIAEALPSGVTLDNEQSFRPRGKVIDYDKLDSLLSKGLNNQQVAILCQCSESTVKTRKKTLLNGQTA